MEDTAVVPDGEVVLFPANAGLNVVVVGQDGVQEVQDQL